MVYNEIIQGKTVRLRSIEEKDAEATYKMRTDPEKAQFVHAVSGTVEDQREFIRKQRLKPDDYLFVVEDLQGRPIGMKGVYNLNRGKNEVETGRFMGFGSQVQNIEALLLGFDFAFNILLVDRVLMSALDNNSVMLGIQKRFGVEFTYRDRSEGFMCDNVHSVLTREAYTMSRPKVMLLIDRFAERF